MPTTWGMIYSYGLVEGDLLEGAGPELIGLQLAADGNYDGEPKAIAEKVCAAYPTGGGTAILSAADALRSIPASSCS
jgi:hypothetical protein